MYRRGCYTLTRVVLQSLQLQEIPFTRNLQITLNGCYRHRRTPIYSQVSLLHTNSSLYAKSKSKGKSSELNADEDAVNEIVDLPKFKEALEKINDSLKQDFMQQLSLRTNVGNFEKLQIKTKDGVFPLNQLASIIQKNPTLIVINLSQSVAYVPDVMTALRNSGMNVNPQQDGPTTIFIPIAKISREHREELAKNAKKLFNQTKEKLNSLYSSYTKKLQKNKDLSISTRKGAENLLLQEKKLAQDKAEQMMKTKQNELLAN